MLINSAADFYSALLQGSYAWPGGYPTYWIMADGEALMFNVAFTEAKLMLDALTHPEYRDEGMPFTADAVCGAVARARKKT